MQCDGMQRTVGGGLFSALITESFAKYPAGIGASVVHENEFHRSVGNLTERGKQSLQGMLAVKDGNDY